MKAVILAGGRGTRLSEETQVRPKPMVEIGGRPILWHIMKIYSANGIYDFIVCLGYKGYMIKEFFSNYYLHMSDITFDMRNNDMCVHQNNVEPWKVTLVDTGELTETGGRLKRVEKYLGEEPFCFTYGDGLANVDIAGLIAFHNDHGRLATVTATQPPGRYGSLVMGAGDRVTSFDEKPLGDGGWINGGFFILAPEVLDFIDNDACIFEQKPMQRLADADELRAWKHRGFWRPMDTLRDKVFLEQQWETGKAPWRVW